MASKPAKMLRNAEVVLIDQTKAHNPAQPGKGRPINMQKHREMLKLCLLTLQKLENMHNQLKDG